MDFEDVEESAKKFTGKIVEEINESEVLGNFAEGIVNALPDDILNKLSLLLDIGKIFLIILIVFFIVLIIKNLIKLKDSYRIKIIVKETKEINDRLKTIVEQNNEMYNFLRKKKDK